MKARIGSAKSRSYGDIAGFAEQWMKRAMRGRREEVHHATWIEVDKTIWSDRGLQLAIVHVGDEEWWSMVMPDATRVTKSIATWMLDHADALSEATSCSFPTWLLDREASREAGRAS